MSTLQIEERISVDAPPARVWRFLLDPARVAACLPGARLDGTEGDKTFLGTMKVKVGPVLMEFKGKATMSEVLPEERRVTLTGTGNDKSGGGSAKMDMKSQVLEREGGGSEIVVIAGVDLAGKLVRFGRGMMDGISKQLFKQFSERVRAALEGADEEEEEEEDGAGEEEHEELAPTLAAPAAEATPAPPTQAALANEEPAAPTQAAPAKEETAAPTKEERAAPTQAAPAKEETAAPTQASTELAATPKAPETAGVDDAPATVVSPSPVEPTPADAAAPGAPAAPLEEAPPAPEVDQSVSGPAAPAATELPAAAKEPPVPQEGAPAPGDGAPPRKKKPSSKKSPSTKAALAPQDNAPLDAGSLVWSAIWAWIKGLLSRIFGKKSD